MISYNYTILLIIILNYFILIESSSYSLVLLSSYTHKIVRIMNGRSSILLREEFSFVDSRVPSLWTRSYFIATTGGAQLSTIKEYVQNQKLRS